MSDNTESPDPLTIKGLEMALLERRARLVERRKGAEPGSRPEIVASAQVRQIDDVLAAIASGDLIELDHPWVV